MSVDSHEALLRSLLETANVVYQPLTESQRADVEQEWRTVYAQAFRGRPRLRHGPRADFEYSKQSDQRWFVVPLEYEVAGTSIHPIGLVATGYLCEGNLIPLGAACALEFAVTPIDLSWTMLYTHEDHALGGPYFIRREWLMDGERC